MKNNSLIIDFRDTFANFFKKEDIITNENGWSNVTSDNKIASEKLVKSSLDTKLNINDITDNLTTNDSTKVLSAKQGKVLNDLIGDAITYINQ